MVMKYISNGTWFDKGTICEKVTDCQNVSGIYKGLRNGEIDEELCQDEEFKEIK
jgi:hypothetical protein